MFSCEMFFGLKKEPESNLEALAGQLSLEIGDTTKTAESPLRLSTTSITSSGEEITTLISEDEIGSICTETSVIATQVKEIKSVQNHSEQHLWAQDIPTIYLDCKQLIRSVQTTSDHMHD
jgi:hypothetical protein